MFWNSEMFKKDKNCLITCSREMRWTPKQEVRAKRAIGNQQMKSVKTRRAIRLAILQEKSVRKVKYYFIIYFL